MKRKTAYGYTRSAAGETSHIQLQQMRIKDYCKENNIKLVEIFDDNRKSGLNAFQNDALEELLSRCSKKDKINAVIVADSDRLSRNSEDYHLIKKFLEKKGIELIAINNQYLFEEPSHIETFIDDLLEVVHAFEDAIVERKQKYL